MKYNSDDRYISKITGWIRVNAKVLVNRIANRSAELKRITDTLWISAIDMKNRKFKLTPEGFEYNIHEVALFILISDGIFLYHFHGPSKEFLQQLMLNPIENLKKLYPKVKCIGQYPFFGSLIVELMPEHDEALNTMMGDMFHLISEIFDQNGHDILGKIFNELIPSEIRRRMGAFFTTDVYAALLSMLAISRFDVKVLDLSCGSGSLLNEALIWKSTLYQSQKELPEKPLKSRNRNQKANQEHPTKITPVSDMFGCDILMYSTSLAWLNLMNNFLRNTTNSSEIHFMKENRDTIENKSLPYINIFMVDALSVLPSLPFSHFGASLAEKRDSGRNIRGQGAESASFVQSPQQENRTDVQGQGAESASFVQSPQQENRTDVQGQGAESASFVQSPQQENRTDVQGQGAESASFVQSPQQENRTDVQGQGAESASFVQSPQQENRTDVQGQGAESASFVQSPQQENRTDVQGQGKIPFVDVVLMNPPFSMSRSMDSDLKRVLIERMAKLGLERYIDRNMGLHGYFILHSDQFLLEGGTLALIIPASTFDSDYSLPLIRFLKDRNYSIEYLIEILSESSAFSYNCSFKELIFIGTKGALAADSTTLVVSITKDLDYYDLNDVYSSILHEKTDNLVIVKRVRTDLIYKNSHWTLFFDDNHDILDTIFKKGHFHTLKEDPSLKLIRGFDGTYLEFVCVPNKYWAIESISSSHSTSIDKQCDDSKNITLSFTDSALSHCRNAREPILIPRRYLLPSIRSSKYIPGIIGLPTHFVFDISDNLLADHEYKRMKTQYFDVCSELMLEKWTEKSKNGHYQRDPPEDWFRHPNRNNCSKTVGHIVHLYKYSFLTRSSIVVYCPTEITVSNGFGYVIQTSDDEFYMAWFSSTLYLYVLFKNQKAYSKGFFKVMVESLNKVYIPIYPKSSTITGKIREAYRKLSSVANLASLKHQIESRFPERVSLDRAWLEWMGYSDSEIKDILENLYTYCQDAIKNR